MVQDKSTKATTLGRPYQDYQLQQKPCSEENSLQCELHFYSELQQQ